MKHITGPEASGCKCLKCTAQRKRMAKHSKEAYDRLHKQGKLGPPYPKIKSKMTAKEKREAKELEKTLRGML